MKIALIGNCQVTPIARIFRAVLPDVDVDAYEVWQMSPADFRAAGDAQPHYDVIISQPVHAPQYGPLTTDALRTARSPGQQLVLIHNIHFEGTLPDCTYVGKTGKRVPSPMAGYHSRIILDAFRAGQSLNDCVAAVGQGGGLSPAHMWHANMTEFRRRETTIDVPFADQLHSVIKRRRCLHMFNHPSQYLLEQYAAAILTHILGNHAPKHAVKLPDLLVAAGVWPVYSWVAEKFSLPYHSNMYVPPRKSGRKPMTIREFSERCFDIYATFPKEQLVH